MTNNQDIHDIGDLPTVSLGRNQLSGHCLRFETEGVTQARYTRHGAIRVMTGERTGRSQDARYFVTGSKYDSHINWNVKLNQPFESKLFEMVWQDALSHAKLAPKPLFFNELYVGANTGLSRKLKVYTHYAWQMIFAKNMFIELQKRVNLDGAEEWTILNDPSFLLHRSYNVKEGRGIFIDFSGKRILLAGMHYGGEMKKSVFTMMNTQLPLENMLTMHCAANVGSAGDTTLFLALSGGGKTTLSSDGERFLIGDDEHIWCDEGISNMEGGCYAKGIGVSPETEPDIYKAIYDGAIVENADLDDDNVPILHNPRIENVRISYARTHIKNIMPGNQGGHPENIFFLTRDAYGVLPAISKLSPEAALFHFANAYTTEGGGTVMGQEKETVKHKFSFGYGAAFFPLHFRCYTDLLEEKIRKHHPKIWLVNTGWRGGTADTNGRRFPLAVTRRIIHAALNGELDDVPTRHLDELNLDIPEQVPGIDANVLDPELAWNDKGEYGNIRKKLIGYYLENHEKNFKDLPEAIRAAGPKADGL
ncbi:MAG: phosphoenolpyruvate carboxykinase (ATP) [Candidatus Paceibacterota bacterium]|jgi:phosphoenolpyruvate carboxykinase (ATP)